MSAFFRKPPLGTVKYWRNFLFLKYLRCLLVEEKKSKTLKYKCSKIHRHSCAFLAPCTSDSPFILSSFSSGQRNRAYCASQPQKSVTLQPQQGNHEVWEDMWWHWRGGKKLKTYDQYNIIITICSIPSQTMYPKYMLNSVLRTVYTPAISKSAGKF